MPDLVVLGLSFQSHYLSYSYRWPGGLETCIVQTAQGWQCWHVLSSGRPVAVLRSSYYGDPAEAFTEEQHALAKHLSRFLKGQLRRTSARPAGPAWLLPVLLSTLVDLRRWQDA